MPESAGNEVPEMVGVFKCLYMEGRQLAAAKLVINPPSTQQQPEPPELHPASSPPG